MFVQVILGTCSKPAEVRELGATWRDGDGASAVGWLGGTFGVTVAGQFVGVVRFASADDAAANSQRPETGEFAAKLAALMEGPMEFHDCADVMTFLGGGSDDAGFVQVIRGHTDNAGPIKGILADGHLREMRPDILGGSFASADDGTFFQTIYFADEASARQGEGQPPPPEIQEVLAKTMVGATFYDLADPWFDAPRTS